MTDHDEDVQWDRDNERLSNEDPRTIQTQEDLVVWLESRRQMSWDIPSALPFTPYGDDPDIYDYGEVPMHRPADYATSDSIFYSWDNLDEYYRNVYGLDLKDERINWSFDT